MSERLKALRRKMRREGVSALAVTDLRNLRYLTGFTGTAGGCFVTERSAVFITDFRYRSQVSRQVDKAFKFSEYKVFDPYLLVINGSKT